MAAAGPSLQGCENLKNPQNLRSVGIFAARSAASQDGPQKIRPVRVADEKKRFSPAALPIEPTQQPQNHARRRRRPFLRTFWGRLAKKDVVMAGRDPPNLAKIWGASHIFGAELFPELQQQLFSVTPLPVAQVEPVGHVAYGDQQQVTL